MITSAHNSVPDGIKRQLLLVEDNHLFAEQITDAMQGLPDDWQVTEFSEGLVAKDWIEHQIKAVDLVLVDLGLPDVSGIEVIRTCRERFADMPIVVISVVASESAVLTAIEAGANGYILKDESISEITEGIQQVLIVEGVQAGELIVKDNGLLLAREFRIAQENAHKPAEAK